MEEGRRVVDDFSMEEEEEEEGEEEVTTSWAIIEGGDLFREGEAVILIAVEAVAEAAGVEDLSAATPLLQIPLAVEGEGSWVEEWVGGEAIP